MCERTITDPVASLTMYLREELNEYTCNMTSVKIKNNLSKAPSKGW